MASDPLEYDQARKIEGCLVDAAALRAKAYPFGRRHDALFPQGECMGGFAGTCEDNADALQLGE